MKQKKHWAMLIVGLIAIAAVWYFIYRKSEESSYDSNLLILGGPLMQREYVNSPTAPSQVIPGVKPFALNPSILGKKAKLTAPITNTPKGCPQGSHQTQLPDGTYSCVPNVA